MEDTIKANKNVANVKGASSTIEFTQKGFCYFNVAAESFRWNQRNFLKLDLEVVEMPPKSKLFIQYSYDT